MKEAESYYWTIVRGRVATLGQHHIATRKARDSLKEILRENGTWESLKEELENL